MVLETFILIAACIVIISTLLSGFLYYTYRDQLLKYLLGLWVSACLGFILQGVFNNLGLSGFLAFSTNALGVACLLLIDERAAGIKFPWKVYMGLTGLSTIASSALFINDQGFTLSSTPFALAMALILFHAAMTSRTTKLGSLHTAYRVMLFLNAWHFIDYPIFRADETLGAIGFAITLSFYFYYAAFIPLFIMKQISDNTIESSKIKSSHEQKIRVSNDLKSLTL